MRFVVLLLVLAPAVFADQASKDAKIDEMLALVNADALMKQVFEQMNRQMDTMVKTLADQYKIPAEKRGDLAAVTKKMTDILVEDLSWARMKPIYIRIYEDVYTEEELDGLLAFYKSPVGQSFLKKTPVIMQKSVESVQGLMPQIMADVQKAATDSLQQLKK